MKIMCVMSILSFALNVPLECSHAQSPQDNLVIKVTPQKAAYLAESPVFLKVGLFNMGNVPVELEIPENFPQGISVVPAASEHGRGINLLREREIREGDPRVEKTLPTFRKVKIQAKNALIWEFPAEFTFTETGRYRLDFALPEIRLTQGGHSPISAKGQLEFVVIRESDTIKDGIEASVELVEPADGQKGELKWKLSPPKRTKMPVPYFQFGNCRIVIRDAKNKIVHDLVWDPPAQSSLEESWKDAIEWGIAMDSASFGFSGNLFPNRGLYTVEAHYRAYISSTGNQATQGRVRLIGEFDGGLYVTSSELEEKREKPWPAVKPQEVQKLDPKDFVSDTGRWISYSIKFSVEVTDNTWRKRSP